MATRVLRDRALVCGADGRRWDPYLRIEIWSEVTQDEATGAVSMRMILRILPRKKGSVPVGDVAPQGDGVERSEWLEREFSIGGALMKAALAEADTSTGP